MNLTISGEANADEQFSSVANDPIVTSVTSMPLIRATGVDIENSEHLSTLRPMARSSTLFSEMSSSRVVPDGSIGSSDWVLGGMESKQLRIRISNEISEMVSDIQLHHQQNALPTSLERIFAESVEILHQSLFPENRP